MSPAYVKSSWVSLALGGGGVILIFVGFFALLAAIGPKTPHNWSARTECMNNVRQLVGLLEMLPPSREDHSGAAYVLQLVARGELDQRRLEVLFCPGDGEQSLAAAGGAAAYASLDLASGDLDRLTSYAGRRWDDTSCAREPRPFIVISDDSDDHHDGQGLVVGISGGAARFRDKMDDWGLDYDAQVVVGERSVVRELRCLSRD